MRTSVYKLFFLVVLSIFSIHAIANEPRNLAFVLKELKNYHDSGRYDQDVNHVISQAKQYIQKKITQNKHAKHPHKLAVVLDIDETSLSNYGYMVKRGFYGTSQQFHREIMQADAPALKSTLGLYKWLQHQGVDVFFVTGRNESERQATVKNLKHEGFHHWKALYMRPVVYHKHSIVPYKSQARKTISAQGYDVVASIGDQKSDYAGGFTQQGFKLPNPFYYLP